MDPLIRQHDGSVQIFDWNSPIFGNLSAQLIMRSNETPKRVEKIALPISYVFIREVSLIFFAISSKIQHIKLQELSQILTQFLNLL